MVWIKIFFLFLLLHSSIAYSAELNEEEEMYFNFVDLNNDGFISYEEIGQSLNPVSYTHLTLPTNSRV